MTYPLMMKRRRKLEKRPLGKLSVNLRRSSKRLHESLLGKTGRKPLRSRAKKRKRSTTATQSRFFTERGRMQRTDQMWKSPLILTLRVRMPQRVCGRCRRNEPGRALPLRAEVLVPTSKDGFGLLNGDNMGQVLHLPWQ